MDFSHLTSQTTGSFLQRMWPWIGHINTQHTGYVSPRAKNRKFRPKVKKLHPKLTFLYNHWQKALWPYCFCLFFLTVGETQRCSSRLLFSISCWTRDSSPVGCYLKFSNVKEVPLKHARRSTCPLFGYVCAYVRGWLGWSTECSLIQRDPPLRILERKPQSDAGNKLTVSRL